MCRLSSCKGAVADCVGATVVAVVLLGNSVNFCCPFYREPVHTTDFLRHKLQGVGNGKSSYWERCLTAVARVQGLRAEVEDEDEPVCTAEIRGDNQSDGYVWIEVVS